MFIQRSPPIIIPHIIFFWLFLFHADNLWARSLFQKNMKQKKISSGNLLPRKNLSSNRINFRVQYFSQRSNSIMLIQWIYLYEIRGSFFSDFLLLLLLLLVEFFMLRSNARMRFSLPLWRPFFFLKQREKYYEKNALQIHDFYNNNNSNGRKT